MDQRIAPEYDPVLFAHVSRETPVRIYSEPTTPTLYHELLSHTTLIRGGLLYVSIFFVLQLLGAAFLGIGLWAWAEKVRTNTGMHTPLESITAAA